MDHQLALTWISSKEIFFHSAKHVFDCGAKTVSERRDLRYLCVTSNLIMRAVMCVNRIILGGILPHPCTHRNTTHFFFEDEEDYDQASQVWAHIGFFNRFHKNCLLPTWEYTKWRTSLNGVYHRIILIRRQGASSQRSESLILALLQELQNNRKNVSVEDIVAAIVSNLIQKVTPF